MDSRARASQCSPMQRGATRTILHDATRGAVKARRVTRNLGFRISRVELTAPRICHRGHLTLRRPQFGSSDLPTERCACHLLYRPSTPDVPSTAMLSRTAGRTARVVQPKVRFDFSIGRRIGRTFAFRFSNPGATRHQTRARCGERFNAERSEAILSSIARNHESGTFEREGAWRSGRTLPLETLWALARDAPRSSACVIHLSTRRACLNGRALLVM